MFSKQMFAMHAETMGRWEKFEQTSPAELPPS